MFALNPKRRLLCLQVAVLPQRNVSERAEFVKVRKDVSQLQQNVFVQLLHQEVFQEQVGEEDDSVSFCRFLVFSKMTFWQKWENCQKV